jgi:hypothetical protein
MPFSDALKLGDRENVLVLQEKYNVGNDERSTTLQSGLAAMLKDRMRAVGWW